MRSPARLRAVPPPASISASKSCVHEYRLRSFLSGGHRLGALRSMAIASTFLACSAIGAVAGPNAGGVLLVHTGPFDFSVGETPSGRSNLERCLDGDTNAPSASTVAFWIHAAFPADGSPRLASVSFGIDYPASTVVLVDHGASGDSSFDAPNWPAPGTGTTVHFDVPRQDILPEVYWFAGYDYYSQDPSFDLVPHPGGAPGFEDDSIPPAEDMVTAYGRLGFGSNPGFLPCPAGPPVGACCLSHGECVILTEAQCGDVAGTFHGDIDCSPTPCLGACCFPDGSCAVQSVESCGWDGGAFLGTDEPCDPNPCPPPPVGACCFTDGRCEPLDAFACADAAGDYLGDGFVCDPDPCPDPGACCLVSGDCLVRMESECLGADGDFLGEGSSCSPNPCVQPDGACCHEELCTLETEADCTTAGGAFAGDFSECYPELCTDAGACCFGEACEVELLAACLGGGGIFLGDSVPCEPGACLGWDCDAELRPLAELGVAAVRPRTVPLLRLDDSSTPLGSTPRISAESGVPCGPVLMNSDETYESGYSYPIVGGGGFGEPCFGAFAESFTSSAPICAVVLDLAQLGGQSGDLIDVYVWENGDGHPGAVRSVAIGVDPGPVAVWPSVSRHVLSIDADPGGETCWAGYWGAPGVIYVAADLDGPEPGGTPMTLVKPNSGYSFSGWQNVDALFGSAHALGIGVALVSDPSSAPEPGSHAAGLSVSAPWPNPVSDRLTVALALQTRDTVRVRILDVLGRTVLDDGPREYRPGTHPLAWSLPTTMENGTYFLLVEGTSGSATQRVTLLR
ncbi:MAG: hypothetical protein R3E97_04180 [Candidatus Eisenbacteria bacterium]